MLVEVIQEHDVRALSPRVRDNSDAQMQPAHREAHLASRMRISDRTAGEAAGSRNGRRRQVAFAVPAAAGSRNRAIRAAPVAVV